MKAPFPWFGGKSSQSAEIWKRLGNVPNYVEPFFGSGAVLLRRPHEPRIETVNDKDGYVSNFWRAVKHDPEKVAEYADWPVNENDLHARHIWLVNRKDELVERLEGDPDFYDAKIAGWWVWGMACWIGSGFCSGNGPWGSVDGKLVHLGDTGQGVKRQLVHLSGAGQGVKRQLVHLGDAGQGEAGNGECGLLAWILALSDRLARVRVCSGDWNRVCGPTPTIKQGLTGIFFDPPYSAEANRDNAIYAEEDIGVAHVVRDYCIEWGNHPMMRIALCGYIGEHELLQSHGWTAHYWTAHGGMGVQSNGRGRENREREVIWFSPNCLKGKKAKQLSLFEEATP